MCFVLFWKSFYQKVFSLLLSIYLILTKVFQEFFKHWISITKVSNFFSQMLYSFFFCLKRNAFFLRKLFFKPKFKGISLKERETQKIVYNLCTDSEVNLKTSFLGEGRVWGQIWGKECMSRMGIVIYKVCVTIQCTGRWLSKWKTGIIFSRGMNKRVIHCTHSCTVYNNLDDFLRISMLNLFFF